MLPTMMPSEVDALKPETIGFFDYLWSFRFNQLPVSGTNLIKVNTLK